jgi:hypothetical protein
VANTDTVKDMAEKNNNKLGPATWLLLRTTHAAGAEIVRVSGLDKSYVYKMIRGERPPSREFIEAVGPALLNLGTRFQTAALEHEYQR